jgi:hypothetical protein
LHTHRTALRPQALRAVKRHILKGKAAAGPERNGSHVVSSLGRRKPSNSETIKMKKQLGVITLGIGLALGIATASWAQGGGGGAGGGAGGAGGAAGGAAGAGAAGSSGTSGSSGNTGMSGPGTSTGGIGTSTGGAATTSTNNSAGTEGTAGTTNSPMTSPNGNTGH